MKRDFERLEREQFDLIVIGGGIIGTGIARDATLRGLKTLLVEKEDFACGTTSRSSRLIHGGLRYLRTLQFNLVRQDLKEREILLKIAPHLVHGLRFIIPVPGREFLYRFALPFGLYLYDILAMDRSLPRWERFSWKETLQLEPALAKIKNLVGSYLYHDCQAEYTERLCLENAISSAEKGGCILNHAIADRLLPESQELHGIQIQDTLTQQKYIARGRIVVNAGGHWADIVLNKLGIKSKYKLRKTKGVHLFTKKLSKNALVLFAEKDGRLFFVIPWGNYSLVGTTDTDYSGDPDNVYADTSDVNYLATELRHYFPEFRLDDVYYTMAGIRPLVSSGEATPSDTSRSYKIVDHEKMGVKGIITVLGGKITAYRGIAEEVTNLVCKKLKLRTACITAASLLPGAPAVEPRSIEQSVRETGLPQETVAHLAALYGSRFSTLLNYVRADKRLGQPICPSLPDILAQVKHAIEEEQALTISDFLLRRTSIGLEPSQGLDAVETVAREMGTLLQWDTIEQQNQIEKYRRLAGLGQNFRLNP